MMGFGALWLVLLVAVGGVAIALVATNRAGGGTRGEERERAHAILRGRLASGEIDQDDYRERAELLGSPRGSAPPVGRWLPVALVVLVVLVLFGMLLAGTGRPGDGWRGRTGGGHMDGMMGQRTVEGPVPAAVPGADEVVVDAGEMWFDPSALEVTAGEPVNLTVSNRGRVFHDLTIDEFDLRIDVDSAQSTTAGLDLDVPGTYDFYCSVPGHATAGMQGVITVVEPRT